MHRPSRPAHPANTSPRLHTPADARVARPAPSHRPLAWALACAAAIGLSACGGGGGGEPEAEAEPVTAPDPLLGQQWHLANTGQSGGTAGQDLRLPEGLSGQGVRVALLDGAIQIGHPDLAPRFNASAGFNYGTQSTDPSPPSAGPNAANDSGPGGIDDAHGTAVAGIIAASADNGIGGRGVAPQAQLIGFNVLSNSTAPNLADALRRAVNQGAAVVNNAWGSPDPSVGGNASFYRADPVWQSALDHATTTARNGLGAVLVFAAGNGRLLGERADYDAYANDHRVLTVGAVDHHGRPASYSEPSANLLVSGFASNTFVRPGRGGSRSAAGITSTDIAGARGYTEGDHLDFFGGTSAAAPMVSGVAALMLQAKPSLGWRDVRWLLAQTARAPSGLATEASPHNPNGFHHRTGFGIVDARAATDAARSHTPLGPQRSCDAGWRWANTVGSAGLTIPDNQAELPVLLSWDASASCPLQAVETVRLEVEIEHPYSGDLRLRLTSPSGLVSEFAEPHACTPAGQSNTCTSMLSGIAFSSVRHMGEGLLGTFGLRDGESQSGRWQLAITDEQANDTGTVLRWRLQLHGH